MREVWFAPRGLARAGAVVGLALGFAGNARAVDTSTWEVAGPAGFATAETEKISVTSAGVAELAPHLEALASPGESYVWSIAAAPNGNAYAGTGDNGIILRIAKSAKEGQADTLHDTVELEIMAMAIGPDGAVYAGGSPDGVILKLKDGKVETFFDSPESYVWALGFAENGDLFVATGDRGRLYRVSRDGQGEVWYDSDEVHLLSLLRGASGHWIVGTSGAGLVLEVSGKDKARVLYDAPEDEIKALLRDPAGNLYFAAVGGAGGGGGGGGGGVGGGGGGGGGESGSSAAESGPQAGGGDPNVIEVTPVRPSRRGGESEREARGPRGSVYRQSPTGATIRLWRAPEAMVNTLEWDEHGTLLAGTGDDGALYRLDARGTATRLLETKESQVLALRRTEAGVLIGTANPGKVYRLGPGVEPEGTLTSKPFDAANVAAWGRITFTGEVPPGSEIELRTRSGNTEKPDESWSDWSNPISDPAGSEITSPTARFIQWQAKLTGRGATSPHLTAVKVAFRQENLPPRLQLVDVDDTGDRLTPGGADRSPDRVTVTLSNGVQAEFSRMQAAPRPVRRDQVPWLRDVKVANWLAEDPNGDRLAFDLFVRSEKENRWRPLAEEVPDQTHAFPTASFADGRYQLRVVATDRPSNPEAGSMADSLDSTYFLIDNTPPAIAALRVERSGSDKLTVSATVTDELSSVRAFEYSLDARTWEPVFPEDGIFDSFEERFRFTIDLAAARAQARTEAARSRGPVTPPGLTGGEMVFVQAADAAGNEGTARAVAP